jgi:hypothetical protein
MEDNFLTDDTRFRLFGAVRVGRLVKKVTIQ